jgi:hypothetical protein
MRATP